MPGQPDRLAVIAGIMGVETEVDEGQQLSGRIADLPGQGPRAASLNGGLGSPAHQAQYSRPAGQSDSQRPGRRPTRDGIADRGEMAERCS